MVITHFRNSVSFSPPFSSCFYLYLKNPIETGPRHHTNEIQRNTDRWFSKLISRINYLEINIFILVGLFRIFISFVPTRKPTHNTNQMKKKMYLIASIFIGFVEMMTRLCLARTRKMKMAIYFILKCELNLKKNCSNIFSRRGWPHTANVCRPSPSSE